MQEPGLFFVRHRDYRARRHPLTPIGKTPNHPTHAESALEFSVRPQSTQRFTESFFAGPYTYYNILFSKEGGGPETNVVTLGRCGRLIDEQCRQVPWLHEGKACDFPAVSVP